MSGCAKDPEIITRTEIQRIKPPESLLEPIEEPKAPPVKDGELRVQDIIEWYEQWIADLQKAFREAEADKQKVLEWGQEEGE